MDIKINAQSRYVELVGITDTDSESAANLALSLWESTAPEDDESTLEGGSGGTHERKDKSIGFTWNLGAGDQLDVT